MSTTPTMSPILLSPGNRLVTVFGGGKVALRKCRHFAGFRIRVVSDRVLDELREIAGEVVEESVDPSTAGRFIEGSDIVVAATNDHSLNDAIRDISMGMGVMTNSAHGGGDVLIPSVVRRPMYTVTVSSEGRVPAFPPYVAEKLEEFLDPSYDRMMELLCRLRPYIRERIAEQPDRAAFLSEVLHDEDIWHILETDGVDAAFEACAGKVGA